MGTVFHYTGGFGLACILKEKRILPFATMADEEPAVWFSTSETWDPTARPPLESVLGADWGRWRIVVDEADAPVAFGSYAIKYPQAAQEMAAIGRCRGADPEHWRVRWKPLPSSLCQRIDRLDADGSWKPVRWEWFLKLFAEARTSASELPSGNSTTNVLSNPPMER
jgi:hypothetical protein